VTAEQLSLIVNAAIRTIRETQTDIEKDIRWNPVSSFRDESITGTDKTLKRVDLVAEQNTERALRDKLGLGPDELLFLGEEQLSIRQEAKDLTKERKLVVLVDMVDGTDLLERGLSNWCSAMIFFDPRRARGEKILAAFVGIHEDGVYYATQAKKEALKHRCHIKEGQFRDVPLSGGLSKVRKIAEASICFYGQQVGNLAWVAEHKPFLDHLQKLARDQRPLKTRIYNLAGNPMMVKMIEPDLANQADQRGPLLLGYTQIDAVFDACGQAPHDVIAGAYIAWRAGAVLSSLDGTLLDLEQSLLHPADPEHRLYYTVASTEALSKELGRCLPRVYDKVDANDNVVGKGTKYQIQREGLWRRMVHIFLVNSQNELLICKRPATAAIAYPGLWTSSAGGHVERGQQYEAAARQELKEEHGLSLPVKDLGPFKVEDDRGKVIHHLFEAVHDGTPLQPDPGEIEEWAWRKPDEIASDVAGNPQRYAEPFKKALELYQATSPHSAPRPL